MARCLVCEKETQEVTKYDSPCCESCSDFCHMCGDACLPFEKVGEDGQPEAYHVPGKSLVLCSFCYHEGYAKGEFTEDDLNS